VYEERRHSWVNIDCWKLTAELAEKRSAVMKRRSTNKPGVGSEPKFASGKKVVASCNPTYLQVPMGKLPLIVKRSP
jgi:hypothetical protein